MPYDLYWNEDSKYLQMYLDIFKDNQKRLAEDRVEQIKTEAWLNGFYVKEALLSTVGNMFNKGAKFHYPSKPYDGEDNNTKSDEDKISQDEALLQRNYMEMLEWTKYFNNRKEKTGDSE